MDIKNFIKNRLVESLEEAHKTRHFIDRVKERIEGIYDLKLKKEFFKEGDDVEALKKGMISKFKELLHTKVNQVSSYTFPSNNDDTIVAKLGRLYVQRDGVKYSVTVLVKYTVETKEGQTYEEEKIGNMYIAQVYNDRLTTLIVSSSTKTDEELLNAHIKNNERSGYNVGNTGVNEKFASDNLINMDTTSEPSVPVQKPVSKPEVVKDKAILNTKTNYKKGDSYEHPSLGVGKIVSSYQFLPNENLINSLIKNYDPDTVDQIKAGNADFHKISVKFMDGSTKMFIVPAIKNLA